MSINWTIDRCKSDWAINLIDMVITCKIGYPVLGMRDQVTDMMHNTWDSFKKKTNCLFFLYNYFPEMKVWRNG